MGGWDKHIRNRFLYPSKNKHFKKSSDWTPPTAEQVLLFPRAKRAV